MFDVRDVAQLASLDPVALATVPIAEDDFFEYKSSLTNDSKLAEKLTAAASGFWNSGGGFFLAGLDGSGDPDGGIASTVGTQPRRDWVDQHLMRVEPRGQYTVAVIGSTHGRGRIDIGKCALIVGFQESADVPHMAPDKHYYVRAGAHTIKAGHFLVESLRARRTVTSPVLSVGLQQDSRNSRFVNLAIANLSAAPALDITVSVEPVPPLFQQFYKSATVSRRYVTSGGIEEVRWTMYDQNTHTWFQGDKDYSVTLTYADLMGRQYRNSFNLNAIADLGAKATVEEPLQWIGAALTQMNVQLTSISMSASKLAAGKG